MQNLRIQPITAMFQPMNLKTAGLSRFLQTKVDQMQQQGLDTPAIVKAIEDEYPGQGRVVEYSLTGQQQSQFMAEDRQQQQLEQQQQAGDPTQFFNSLQQAVRAFAKGFNENTIRPYNIAIQQAMKAIQQLSTTENISISPALQQAGTQIMDVIEQIQASDAEDAQLVNQLAGLAQQLASQAGGGATAAPNTVPDTAPNTAPNAGGGFADAAGEVAGRAMNLPGQAMNWVGNQFGKARNWAGQKAQGFGGGYQRGRTSESGHIILTAYMGSASSLIKESHSQF